MLVLVLRTELATDGPGAGPATASPRGFSVFFADISGKASSSPPPRPPFLCLPEERRTWEEAQPRSPRKDSAQVSSEVRTRIPRVFVERTRPSCALGSSAGNKQPMPAD